MRWVLALAFAMLAACALPGQRGWECDHDADCKDGLVCRSMHGDSGYTNVCLGQGESVYAGFRGNWIRLMIVPLVALSLVIAIASRVVEARKSRRRRRG